MRVAERARCWSNWRTFAQRPPFGFDFSAEALKFLRLRGVANVLQASTTDIPFESASFDLVTSFDVLCQLPGEGDQMALHEFHRVLKPGGMVYVRLPAYPWMFANHDRCSLTFQRYYRRTLVAKVERAGFRILKASYANFFLFPALAFKRLVLERLGVLSDSSDLRPIPARIKRYSRDSTCDRVDTATLVLVSLPLRTFSDLPG